MDTARFSPHGDQRKQVRRKWGVGDEDVVVGTVGRLFENKGYEQIIASMPRIVAAAPGARFVWIGSGSNRDSYERLLESRGLSLAE